MKLTLKGNPRSTNTLYRTMCRGNFPTRYMSPEARALKENYQWQAKKQYRAKPLTGEVEVWIELHFGTKRKCDWDNFHKLSLDALTGIVWADDSQIKKASVEVFYDKENPRIELEINSLE